MGVPLADARVQEAFRLLREAGRLDLIQGGMGAPSRPPRRASGGVAAAVLACSESRGAASRQLVSRRDGGRVRACGEGRRAGARSLGDRRVVARGSPKRRSAAGRVQPSGEGAPAAAVKKLRGRVLLVQRGVGTDQECDNREGRQGRKHTRGKKGVKNRTNKDR
ncbi:hypothetical protein NDU88_006461 [Pleurodeles waltl]|uniref:Uncharacterized protein n=1 Tax=Pleurodeles waltl TaxID=8319 RepID=A0AAV7MDD2_PLEWA|nr:hypothetical protein NDU88_006461 [Pleurodeles waltl]